MNYYIYTIGVLVIAAMLMVIVDRAFSETQEYSTANIQQVY